MHRSKGALLRRRIWASRYLYLMFLPVFTEYFRTGLVPRFPTLIVSGFVMIAAIQAFFSGLVLETNNRKNRQDFELELIRVQKMAQQQ